MSNWSAKQWLTIIVGLMFLIYTLVSVPQVFTDLFTGAGSCASSVLDVADEIELPISDKGDTE